MAELRNRLRLAGRHRSDAGFTLVEVMMVVLIIGVLLAIAIPAFRGAQVRAQDAAARSTLATAASSARQLSDAGTDFSQATTAALTAYEPSLSYVDSGSPSTGPAVVSVDSSTNERWIGAVRSQSGACFAVRVDRTGSEVGDARNAESGGCSAREAAFGAPRFTPGATGGTGSYEGSVPDGATIRPDGDRQSNDTIFVYDESRQVLTSDLFVGGTVIPAGTAVCPYLLVYDPVDRSRIETTVEFGGPVLGVARSLSDLRATERFANPGATYEYRAFENNDQATVSGSRMDISIYAVPGNADMLRAFVAC